MGLAASQARLLSITARIANNEFQSQQLSNSKVRLADKTQQASEEYIDALNSTQLTLTTYDSKGVATSVALTPNVLYTYSDLKNQYGISNASGQLLISSTDLQHYQNCNNVYEFIESYGITLADNEDYVTKMTALYGENYAEIFDTSNNKLFDDMQITGSNGKGLDVSAWTNEISDFDSVDENTYKNWYSKLNLPSAAIEKYFPSGSEECSEKNIGTYGELLKILQNIPEYTTDFSVLEESADKCEYFTQVSDELYKDYINQYEQIPDQKIIEKSDSQAQWYENLWHRINGESDYKDGSVDENATSGKYFKLLDDNLLTSKDWLKFALEQGIVTLEQVQTQDIVDDSEGLDGRAWKAVIYSSCTDIVSEEDEIAIAKAEAEYTKTLNEIEAEDKELDNDIKKLDTEHSALTTEHDSIKEVLKKNVENSFKAFS